MKHPILVLMLSLSLTACIPYVVPDTSVLPRHHWHLIAAMDANRQRIDALFAWEGHPVQLEFRETQLVVSNTCNTMEIPYRIYQWDRIMLGPIHSGTQHCTVEKMNQLDEEVRRRLNGTLKLSFSSTRIIALVGRKTEKCDGPCGKIMGLNTLPDIRLLILTFSSGDRLIFGGYPTQSPQYYGETVFLEVAADTYPDRYHPKRQCLRVREVDYDKNSIKTKGLGVFEEALCRPVNGYVHTPGVRNILQVKRYASSTLPADPLLKTYLLEAVVESEVVKP